jgi:hypothetical protein
LVFPYSKKEFHVHVDVSSVALGTVLAQPGEGYLYHPNAFSNKKFSATKHNYITTKYEGLEMV